MNIITRFDLGQHVFPIFQRAEEVTEPCPECDGTGRLALVKGGTTRCTSFECRNGRVFREVRMPWAIASRDASDIGNIQVSLYSAFNSLRDDERRYMLDSTGVGSGRLWDESDLFATAEEAQAECDKRNSKSTRLAP